MKLAGEKRRQMKVAAEENEVQSKSKLKLQLSGGSIDKEKVNNR